MMRHAEPGRFLRRPLVTSCRSLLLNRSVFSTGVVPSARTDFGCVASSPS